MDEYPDVPCLPYAQVRPLIKSGDILFCSGEAAMSQMIRAATGSVWSHVGAVLRAEAIGRVLLCESVESVGVRIVPLSYYIHGYVQPGKSYPGRLFVGRHAGLDGVDPHRLALFSHGAVDLLGRAYDQKEIAGIALRIVAQKLGYPLAPRAPDGVFICSDFLCQWFKDMAITLPYNPGGYVAPSDWATLAEMTFLWELALAV